MFLSGRNWGRQRGDQSLLVAPLVCPVSFPGMRDTYWWIVTIVRGAEHKSARPARPNSRLNKRIHMYLTPEYIGNVAILYRTVVWQVPNYAKKFF